MQVAPTLRVGGLEGVVMNIPLRQIDSGKTNIRSGLGDLSDLEASVVQLGLLSPILVRGTQSSRYEVIAGNRRLRVYARLGIPVIPARVIQATDKECYEISLAENVQRRTLDPIEEARAFYNYVCSKQRRGLGYGSISELARRIGKSQEYISNRIGLLRLRESTLREMLGEKKLTVSHVEELVSISNHPVAVKELSDLIANHRISVRVLERSVQLIKCGVETNRALELAKIESSMRLESKPSDRGNDRVSGLLGKTKRILEYALSYIDTTLPELGDEPGTCEDWVDRVRLPVHRAIDGVIACQKTHGRVVKSGHPLQHPLSRRRMAHTVSCE